MSTLTPQLRFPEFTEEWQVKKLGDVIDNIGGTALEIFAGTSGTRKYISIGSDTTNGKYIDNGQRTILKRSTIVKRVKTKITEFITTFIEGV